jgi:hypothetical protein
MQRRREVTGESSIYSRMQPFDRPEISALYQQRIDYLFVFNKETSDEELCWCQGEVIEINMNPKKQNTVMVRWDPVPGTDTYKDYHTSVVDLLPTFWNKDKDRAWRLDLNVDLLSTQDNESDDESEDESEGESEIEPESEEEMTDDDAPR